MITFFFSDKVINKVIPNSRIHDVDGREMMRRTLHGSTTRLSLAGLSAGIYTISLSSPQGTAIRRLSVE